MIIYMNKKPKKKEPRIPPTDLVADTEDESMVIRRSVRKTIQKRKPKM